MILTQSTYQWQAGHRHPKISVQSRPTTYSTFSITTILHQSRLQHPRQKLKQQLDIYTHIINNKYQTTQQMPMNHTYDDRRLWELVKVLHPTRHKRGHFGDITQVNLLAWYGRNKNLKQQKHTFTNQKKCTTTQNKHKLVATLRGSRPGVQYASLIMTSLMMS